MGKIQSLLIYSILILLGVFILPMASGVAINKDINDSAVLQSTNSSIQQQDQVQSDVAANLKTNSNNAEISTGNNENVEPAPAEDEAKIKFMLPLVQGKLTAKFGNMKNPYTKKIVHHNGIDIASPKGTDVFAAADGKVVTVSTDVEKMKGPGKHLIIEHENGYSTFYSHLDSVLVKVDQLVSSGDVIAKVGTTGMSTGPHLHFEIRKNNEPRNPLDYLEIDKLKKIEK